MQEAITAIKSKKYTIYIAALVFNVPKHTLHDRIKKNMQPRNLAHECDQNLTHAEETELVRWITRLTISGYPPRYKALREMAEEIRKRRVKNINDDGMQLVEYDLIGKDWVRCFILRHSELASVTPEPLKRHESKTPHLNDCNGGFPTFKKSFQNTTSNWKTYTTWMKLDLPSV